jgi:molecular chaperone DnaK (HSP70)
VDSANLLLLHEPEAAAAAATRDYSLQLLPGEKLMIIDAGGGTVDMTLHSVAASSSGDGQPVLKGVVARQGLMAGASFLDKMFMNWARCELGSAQWDAWIEHAPRDYNKFLYKTWEDQKFAFGALDPLCEAELDLPQSLVRELSEETIDSKLQDGYQLIVPAVVMESFFAGLISQMLGKAQGMIREAGGSVDHVLLAGGFAESPYLVRQLRAGLAGLISGSLVVPSHAVAAVVKGELETFDMVLCFRSTTPHGCRLQPTRVVLNNQAATNVLSCVFDHRKRSFLAFSRVRCTLICPLRNSCKHR